MNIKQYELVRECVNNWDYNFQAKRSDQVAKFLCDCMKLHKKERENLVVLSLDMKLLHIYINLYRKHGGAA